MGKTRGMFTGAMALAAVLYASVGFGQSSPPEPAPDPLVARLVELSAAPEKLLAGSPELLVVQDVNLDVNTDGVLDADDITAWYEGIEIAQINSESEILSYVYETRRDINLDGVVDVLDVSLLKTGIAKKRLESGLTLVWQGRTVNPTETPICFDGAHVTSTANGGLLFQIPGTLDESQYSPRSSVIGSLDSKKILEMP